MSGSHVHKNNLIYRISNIAIGLGVLLVAVPVLFWLYGTYYQWHEARQWESVVDRKATSTDNSGHYKTRSAEVTITANSIKDIQAQAAKLAESNPIKPGENIAYLSIPALDLKLSVIEGESWSNLAVGPIHVSKTARIGKSGTALISGHRTMYAAPFHNLHKLVKGDTLVLYTKKAVFTYTVSDIKRVNPDDWSYITKAGYPQVVLSTCDPMYSAAKRLLIISKLYSVEPIPNNAGYKN